MSLRSCWVVFSCVLVTFILVAEAESVKYATKHTKGHCVWYGQCTTGTRAKNCYYNGPAKKLNDTEGIKVLDDTCAEMRGQPTCCNTTQLNALATNLQIMKQLTSRCPACWNNMRRLYCEMTCSKDQSLFMDPKTLTDENTTISDIYYYVSETFKQGLYDSCKDVPFPGNNGKVMKFICGRPERLCSPQILLTFMGSYENGYAPFNIEFPTNLTPDLHWMNKTVFKCNESFFDVQRNRSATPCSCQDCTATCPALPPLPPKPSPHKIAGLDLLSFCLLVTFLTFLVIYIPTSIFCSLLKSRKFASEPAVNNTPFQEVYNPGICERLGSKLESALRHWFTCWGIWCSSHPLLVVGACFVVVGGLSCGLFFFTVTTDPVQLWSSPNSEARRQKDVYDSKFNPFFRTEQLIIRSTHPDSTGYYSYPYGTWVPFGPIFHLDLLNQNPCDAPLCQHSSTCQAGFTDKGYRCLCGSGFCGEHCETDIDECATRLHECSANAVCKNIVGSYNCTCNEGYYGDGKNCRAGRSCSMIRETVGEEAISGTYMLNQDDVKFKVYCHMESEDNTWTLIARFSNTDERYEWMRDHANWWYRRREANGKATNPSDDDDMISPAFWWVSGHNFKITRSDDLQHTALLRTTGDCLGGQTFRAKITSYGNFRNTTSWEIQPKVDGCRGSCNVSYAGRFQETVGFKHANCSGKILSAKKIGFWCAIESTGSVMLIGGGGQPCALGDHGIGITSKGRSFYAGGSGEVNDFSDAGTASPEMGYSLNLWIQ